MNFKEALALEARSVFCNPAEFGESVTIDGVEIVGVWGDTAKPLAGGQDLSGVSDVNIFGLMGDERTLHVPSVENGGIPTPVVGQRLLIDGEYWTVLPGTHTKHGLLKLQLLRVNS